MPLKFLAASFTEPDILSDIAALGALNPNGKIFDKGKKPFSVVTIKSAPTFSTHLLPIGLPILKTPTKFQASALPGFVPA